MRRWRRLLVAAALLAGGVAPAAATTAAATQGLLDFSPDERRRIAAHGPWPPAQPARDAGNNLSRHAAAISLGERLFHDARLAPDGRFSCATCHDPRRGFADGLPRAAGRDEGDRNTPTLLNTGSQRWFGWDGAADSLWHQSIKALLNPREMAATLPHVQRALAADAAYRKAWRQLFGTVPERGSAEQATVRAAKAIGAYTATLTSPRSLFDHFRDALLSGKPAEAAKYPLEAQRGLRLFIGRAGCAICHIGPAFTNGEFADTGLAFFVRPGVVDPGRHGGIQALRSGPTARFNLLGRHADRPPAAQRAHRDEAVKTRHVDLQHRNFGEFKVPGLRALVHTGPYMHDGSLATLHDVVRHYNRIDLERLHADGDRILKPLGLSEGEEADLVAFLESLSTPQPGPYRARVDPMHDRPRLRGSVPGRSRIVGRRAGLQVVAPAHTGHRMASTG